LANGDLAFIWSPRKAYWFTPIDGGTNFKPNFGIKVTLTQASGVYTLTEEDGTAYRFSVASGYLLSTTTPGDQVTSNVFDAGGKIIETRRQYQPNPPSGPVLTESRLYTYYGSEGGENAGELKYITLARSASPTAPIRRLYFTYYGSGDSGGNLHNLRTLTVQVPEGAEWRDVGTRLYRYFGANDPSGYQHGLKCIIGPESFARLSEVADPFTAPDSLVSQFAGFFYTYSQVPARRLSKVVLAGGTRTYTISFTIDPSHADGFNNWRTKAVVTHPDGYQRAFYANHVHQEILNVKRHPTDSNIFWARFTEYVVDINPGKERNNAKVKRTIPPAGITAYQETGSAPYLSVTKVPAGSNKAMFRVYKYGDGTAGKPVGYVIEEKVTNGDEDPDLPLLGIVVRTIAYSSHTVTGDFNPLFLPATVTTIPTPGQSSEDIATSVTYQFYSAQPSGFLPQLSRRTTTMPVIPSGQNGDGQTYTRVEEFDIQNRLVLLTDERTIVTKYDYDDLTGARIRMIEDYSTQPGHFNFVTDYAVDDLGRTIQTLAPTRSAANGVDGHPVRQALWTIYKDADHEIWSAKGYATGTDFGPAYSFTLVNPVSVIRMDRSNRETDAISAVRADTNGPLSSGDSFAQATWVRWTKSLYDDADQMSASWVYHALPSAGDGTPGNNYDKTAFGYDIMGRRNKAVSSGGTITRTVFDPRDLPLEIWVGTNDTGATDSDPNGPEPPSPTVSNPNNMRLIIRNEYDKGLPSVTNPPGNGLLTKVVRPLSDVDSTLDRITDLQYDYRDRSILTLAYIWRTGASQGQYRRVITARWYDNLDRPTVTCQFDTEYTYSTTPPTTTGTNLLSKAEVFTDKRGRVYRSKHWGVNFDATFQPDASLPLTVNFTGTLGNSIEDNTWYGPTDRVVKQKPAGSQAYTKTEYDNLERPIGTYVGYALTGENPWTISDGVNSGDKLFEQTLLAYDEVGTVISSTAFQRNQGDTTSTGTLTTTNSRVTYAAAWFDGVGREIAAATWGTNDGTAVSRPDKAPTASSPNVLVSRISYNNRGEAFEKTDPAGIITHTSFDNAGREIRTIQNYKPAEAGADENVTTETSYTADGNVATIRALNSATGDQTSRYIYGTTLADSEIARSDLLVAESYPDSSDSSDSLRYTYNRQGDRATTSDQNGSRHEYSYDLLARIVADTVLTVGAGVDSHVRRIDTGYEIRGMMRLVTSYPAVAGGTPRNQVLFVYDGFRKLVIDYQAHDGAVSTVAPVTPNVQYTYATGVNNTNRLTSVTYPNGRVLNVNYGPDQDNDKLTRVNDLAISGESFAIVEYNYFGMSSVAKVNYPVQITPTTINVHSTLASGATYPGFDRFGRVINLPWVKVATTTDDLVRIKYGYDVVSTRSFRRDDVARGLFKPFDEIYSYDDVHRLSAAARGVLSTDNSRIDTMPTFSQTWALDSTGNWDQFTEFDDQGSTFVSLDQRRKQNRANEIEPNCDTSLQPTTICSRVGPRWSAPRYDRNGNMTTLPQVQSPTQAYSVTYDAWNRLAVVSDGSTHISTYRYDGLTRRIVRLSGSTTRHYFFTNLWQVLEERVGDNPSTAIIDRSFVWGIRYYDDCVLRDRSVSGGTLNERILSLQDDNWNVVAGYAKSTNTIIERYAYTAYGSSLVLDPSFVARSSSTIDWEVRFSGQRLDLSSLLYEYRWRVYHSGLGVFLARDPAAYSYEGMNLYAYVDAAPTTYTDPFGFAPPAAAAGGLVKEAVKDAVKDALKGIVTDALQGPSYENIEVRGQSGAVEGERCPPSDAECPTKHLGACSVKRRQIQINQIIHQRMWGSYIAKVITYLYFKYDGCDVVYLGATLNDDAVLTSPLLGNRKLVITANPTGRENPVDGACYCCKKAGCLEYEVRHDFYPEGINIVESRQWSVQKFKACGNGHLEETYAKKSSGKWYDPKFIVVEPDKWEK
jgi:RHS repeat-associated protein